MTHQPLINAQLLKVLNVPVLHEEARWSTIQQDSNPTLVFNRGTLEIKNPFLLSCDSGERVTFNSLIGCHVSDSFSNKTEFVIVFEGRIFLAISLREEDFIGPEAAVFQASSGNLVVFGNYE